MATHDYVIDNSTGANVRADLNLVLQAILSNNSSSSAPSTTAAYMWWADTTNGVLKIRNSANNAWVELLQLDGTLTLEDGSASTPALAFRDDLNTGIFSSAADTFNVATGGAERLEISSSNTIFNEAGANIDFRIESDTKTHMLFIDAGDNRIGINEGGPQCMLQITDTGAGGDGVIENLRLNSAQNNTNDGNKIQFTRVNGASGSISCVKVADNNTTDMIFGTRLSNTESESMRLDGSGRLMIGTTTEGGVNADDLTVANSGHAGITIRSGTSSVGSLYFSDGTSGDDEFRGAVQYNHTDNYLRFYSNAVERIRLDSDGKLKIGTTATPTQSGAINVFGTDQTKSQISVRRGSADSGGPVLHFQKSRNTTDGSHTVVQNNDKLGSIIFAGNDAGGPENGARITAEVDSVAAGNDMPGRLLFSVTPDASDALSEAMRIHNSGKISINTTNNNAQLTVNGTSNAGHYVPGGNGGQAQSGIHVGGNHGNSGERGGAISFAAGGTGACAIACRNESTDRDQIGLEFFTHNNSDHTVAADRRMRMSTAGHIFFGSSDTLDHADAGTTGVALSDSLGFMAVSRNSDVAFNVGRNGSDGQLVRFHHDGNEEGNISVSGSTISYNGGHLSRWSQIKGISTTDKSARPTIYQGTVMSNLDDLCVWSYPDQLYTEQDETNGFIPDGKEVGDLRKAAHTEENQQLNMTKVSDTEGDKDVAGVFWTWDDDHDNYYINDFYIAMTGDMVIRVAGSTTVARGDLLISAGDGTAKPQADDIIRSSTIAKITSINSTATYADGSKAYPCVLMAC